MIHLFCEGATLTSRTLSCPQRTATIHFYSAMNVKCGAICIQLHGFVFEKRAPDCPRVGPKVHCKCNILASETTPPLVVLHSGDNIRHVVSFPTLFSCVGSTRTAHAKPPPPLSKLWSSTLAAPTSALLNSTHNVCRGSAGRYLKYC